MTIHETIAIRLKQLMKEHNINQTTLSKLTGISKSTIYNILNNRTKNTSGSNLIKFAEAFDVRVDDIINNVIFNNPDLPVAEKNKNKK